MRRWGGAGCMMIVVLAVAAAFACQQTPTPAPIAAPQAAPASPAAPPVLGADLIRPRAAPGAPPPPIIRMAPGIDWSKEPARKSPPATAEAPSVADLFRERNAREAATKADAAPPAAVPDGVYRCRRTETGMVCGTGEDAMKRAEEASKAALKRLDSQAPAPN